MPTLGRVSLAFDPIQTIIRVVLGWLTDQNCANRSEICLPANQNQYLI